jgi:phosphohistidine phosphatase
MSKRLYLLRHAKSSWKQPELADHDRPLASRGRRAAKAIARHLRERQIAPELVLCSTARRARETLERIEPALATAAVRREPQLYRASADVLFERLRTVPDDVASVMLIGHNPAIEQLALDLLSARSDRADPTAAGDCSGRTASVMAGRPLTIAVGRMASQLQQSGGCIARFHPAWVCVSS